MCLDKNPLIDIFKNQISKMVITIADNRKNLFEGNVSTTVFTHVLSVFTNLRFLKFHSSSPHEYAQRLSFENKPPTFFSSTLMELHANVHSFNDCLYLLDGRFNQLRTFHVKLSTVLRPSRMINNQVGYYENKIIIVRIYM